MYTVFEVVKSVIDKDLETSGVRAIALHGRKLVPVLRS
jgi:hypothetical protein